MATVAGIFAPFLAASLLYLLLCLPNWRLRQSFDRWYFRALDRVVEQLRERRRTDRQNPLLEESILFEARRRLIRAGRSGLASATLWPRSMTGIDRARSSTATRRSDLHYRVQIAIYASPFANLDDRLRHEFVHHCDAIAHEKDYMARYAAFGNLGLFEAWDKGLVTWSQETAIERRVMQTADPTSGFRGRCCRIRRPLLLLVYRYFWAIILVGLGAAAWALWTILGIHKEWNRYETNAQPPVDAGR